MKSNMHTLMLLGNPNCGKTLLFNRLTGLRNKVANFPGVTVEIAKGRIFDTANLQIIDFPGTYSLTPLTRDEELAVENFMQYSTLDETRGVICVLDGTRLERSLFLALQLQQECAKRKISLICAVNMMDELWRQKISIDIAQLSQGLGVPVLAISAKTKAGLSALKEECQRLVEENTFPENPINGDTTTLKIMARQFAFKYGPRGDMLLKSQFSIDKIVLSTLWGSLIFAATMLLFFQSIFTLAAPLMEFIEIGIGAVAKWSAEHLSNKILSDFVQDAIFGGLGSFLVFVPQIFVLTFLVGLLEDSGYLVRAALICHKPLSYIGLSGKSFMPLLTGHACAIPAIFSARTIESPKKRALTLLAIPLMSCSARLPVYGLIIATVIPAKIYLGGILGLQGLSFFLIYLFGMLTAFFVTAITNNTLFKNKSDAPFVLELPPYRVPGLLPLIKKAWERSMYFITNAGPAIFIISVIIWFLGYFPSRGLLESSYLATLGHWIEPLFAPIGVDWKFSVAILMSFLAREVFVGTLGTLMGIEGASENFSSLSDKLHASGLTLASGLALLAFYAIAMQCVATLAVLKKEMGSWKYPAFLFLGYSVLAYVVAVITYNACKILN